ncbi:MAG: hypothetical protein QMC17_07145 [Paracoccaceae bacterium]|jgi:hypothetical protein
MSQNLQPTQTLQMFVQSAELRMHGVELQSEIELSCGLINIARGSCAVRIIPVDMVRNGGLGTISVPIERLLMRGELFVSHPIFTQIMEMLRVEPPRPAALVLALREPLHITAKGDLWLEASCVCDVVDMSWNVPLL